MHLARGGAGGIAVHIAARVMSFADSDVVIVSASVPPLSRVPGFNSASVRRSSSKACLEKWQLYEVV